LIQQNMCQTRLKNPQGPLYFFQQSISGELFSGATCGFIGAPLGHISCELFLDVLVRV